MLRDRARQHIADGAVTRGYGGDTQAAVRVLNAALATELVCVLRYKRHHFMARGIHAGPVAAEFLEHAGDEQEHADRIAERIVQLGGAPDFAPDGLASRSHSEYVEGTTLVDMIKEDLVAERIAIDSYREMIAYFHGVRSDHAKNAGGDYGEGGRACRRSRRSAAEPAQGSEQLARRLRAARGRRADRSAE